MAIVSISRIQSRRGLSVDLPQLTSAELGWTVDTRKLYIGNGTIAEGAPSIGNTEILTQYSDLLALSSAYSYKGLDAGYEIRTGVTANTPVARKMQSVLDERVSVKSFGAAGDGVTDDTASINRALYELFVRNHNPETRRTLYFPAGTYIITDSINVPTYATMVGDGINCTIIQQTASTKIVVSLADSLQQTEPNLGNNGAVLPSNIVICDMTLFDNVSFVSLYIHSANNIRLIRVAFKSGLSLPTSNIAATELVAIKSSPVNISNNIIFDTCIFSNATYAMSLNDNITGIVLTNCYFDELFNGVVLGANLGYAAQSTIGPRGVRLTNCMFNRIADSAIYAYPLITTVTSSNNHFNDVGNIYTGNITPSSPVVRFNAGENYSIGDTFARSGTAALLFPHVSSSNGTTQYPVFSITPSEIQFGALSLEAGRSVTLGDNTLLPAATGIVIDSAKQTSAIIDYQLSRVTTSRSGTIVIATDANGQQFSETFVDTNGLIGITFSLLRIGTSTNLMYTSTATGNAPSFKYTIRSFK